MIILNTLNGKIISYMIDYKIHDNIISYKILLNTLNGKIISFGKMRKTTSGRLKSSI